MLKKLPVFLAFLCIASVCAAVDVNQASEAELDAIKGVGPATTRMIMAEREKAAFTSWNDFIKRVKGMGPKNAINYSAQGLTVGGNVYTGVKNAGTGAGKASD